MASPSQIVPSKNALRALRKLALGGSTIFGAVGSVSGLACVSYDIWQRIQLAESIVETKRVLHSQPISNPHRKAQMAAVFDMYEKGHGKESDESWREFNRRAQRQSAQDNHDDGRQLVRTVNREDTVHRADVANRPPHFKSTRRTLYDRSDGAIMPSKLPCEQMRTTLEGAPSVRRSQNSSAAHRIMEASQKAHKINTHAVYGRPGESRNISPVQKIITATQRQHKLSSNVVFGRPANRKDEGSNALASCVQQWLAPDDAPAAGAIHISSKRPNAPHKAVRKDQPPRYYSSSATSLQSDVGDPATSPFSAARQFDDAFFPNNDEVAVNGSVSPLPLQQPVQKDKLDAVLGGSTVQETSATQPERTIQDLRATPEDVRSKLMALIDSALWVPDTTGDDFRDISAYPVSPIDASPVSTDFRANRMINSGDETTEQDASGEPLDLLESIFLIIPQIKRRSGRVAARKLANDVVMIYAQGGRPEHFRAMYLLYSEFITTLGSLPFTTPLKQMVHFLLNTGLDEDRRRAGRILFPETDLKAVETNDMASTVVNWHFDRKAIGYIDWLCSGRASRSDVVHEFRKLLQALYQRGGEPTEAMFSPVLDFFLERGDLKYLRNMFEEMQTAHQIEPSGLTHTVLLLGYAKGNDWGQIVMEFEKMHQDGLSRKSPMSYAVTFNAVFRQHALSEPVEKTHDFLVNAICYWGLVPSTAISATAVQTYIRHRRYDLIKEWIEAARYMFPHVNTGGEAFAYTLAQTWGEIGANCEQIEDTCASIMQGRDDVMPAGFHAVVREALAFHLARKLHTINADEEPLDEQIHQVKDSDDLFTQLKAAFAVILDDAGDSGVVKQGTVADLLSQTSAALRIRELFGAETRIAAPDVELATNLDRGPRKLANRPSPQPKDLTTPIPAVLRRDLLPDRDTVFSLVSAHYAQQLKLSERVSHEILRVACHGLQQRRRHYDTLCLISTVYWGPAVQGPDGVMFDIGIIQTWLQMAYYLKSRMACKEILAAVLEKGTAIRLTRQFMLLVSMASKKAYGNRFTKLDGQDVNPWQAKQLADLDFLVRSLRDRFWRQRLNAPQSRVERNKKPDDLIS